MTDAQLYIDDMDGDGTSPETSHPRFVKAAPEDFYLEDYDFAPFGSDDGSDALRGLEEWFTEHGADADPAIYLAETIAEWEFDVPDGLTDGTEEVLVAFSAQDEVGALDSEARLRVAVALGQVKITGRLSPEILAEGRRGLRVLQVLHASEELYPDWPHRGEALAALGEIGSTFDTLEQDGQ